MRELRFKLSESLKLRLELLSRDASKKISGGTGIPLPPIDGDYGCGGMCKITCAHYCHATCEDFCGNLSFKA
jgi:modification target Cys-rich repeat protein